MISIHGTYNIQITQAVLAYLNVSSIYLINLIISHLQSDQNLQNRPLLKIFLPLTLATAILLLYHHLCPCLLNICKLIYTLSPAHPHQLSVQSETFATFRFGTELIVLNVIILSNTITRYKVRKSLSVFKTDHFIDRFRYEHAKN